MRPKIVTPPAWMEIALLMASKRELSSSFIVVCHLFSVLGIVNNEIDIANIQIVGQPIGERWERWVWIKFADKLIGLQQQKKGQLAP